MAQLRAYDTYKGQNGCNVFVAFSLGGWVDDDYLLKNVVTIFVVVVVVTIFESLFVLGAVLGDLNASFKKFIPVNNL